jgi:hypothetical protein
MAFKPPRGKPPSQRQKPADTYHTAIHEAGHAVAAIVLKLPLKHVYVGARGDFGGEGISHGHTDLGNICWGDFVGVGPDIVMPRIVQSFAGPMAEVRVNPDRHILSGMGVKDNELAHKWAAISLYDGPVSEDGHILLDANDSRIPSILETALERATQLVETNWPAIAKVAERLTKRKTLTGEEVATIVNDSRPDPA